MKINKLTLNSCIESAESYGIQIYGDIKFRGDCRQEDPELAFMFQYLKNKYPQYESLMFHVPNEWSPIGGSSYAHYNIMISKGYKPRIADFICLPVSSNHPAFVCEMKRLDISKSLNSKDRKKHFIEQLMLLESQKQHGAFACIALGGDNGIKAFEKYLEEYTNE